MDRLLKNKKEPTVHRKYFVPALRLRLYEFPEEFAIWALHFGGIKAHSNTHDPVKKTDISILDQYGRPIGNISFLPAKSQDMVIIVINDLSKTRMFIKAVENYLKEVLGVDPIGLEPTTSSMP